jgi:hypothetical protein
VSSFGRNDGSFCLGEVESKCKIEGKMLGFFASLRMTGKRKSGGTGKAEVAGNGRGREADFSTALLTMMP